MHFLKYLILFAMLWAMPVSALDSDSEQPATLDADEIELDFATGLRSYRGNVILRQGSIRITCDELITYLDEEDELDKAVCTGVPGRFKQRPEGADSDVIGTARTITVDRVKELITLKSQAKVVAGDSVLSGQLITYNMKTETVSARGGDSTTPASTAAASDSASGNSEDEPLNEADSETTAGTRPSLTIQPRKKKPLAAEGDAVSADSDS